jgi:hypothetical protein
LIETSSFRTAASVTAAKTLSTMAFASAFEFECYSATSAAISPSFIGLSVLSGQASLLAGHA